MSNAYGPFGTLATTQRPFRWRTLFASQSRTVDAFETLTITHVDEELTHRHWFRLPFSPVLEARYESDMLDARAWNIRLTLAIGLVAYNIFFLVDGAILPDLGWLPFVWRFVIMSPIALLVIWKCGAVEAGFRESFLAFMMLGATVGPLAFMFMSRSALAPYEITMVILANIFGNITIRLRFHWAVLSTILTVLCLGILLFLDFGIQRGLALHLFLSMLVCACFSLLSNHQLELAERQGFLLKLREILRSDQLRIEGASLLELSKIDPLTQLSNRRAFDAKLAELWRQTQNHGQSFSLLMIDVDFFKKFNDQYGHPAGDTCLKQVAGVLRSNVIREEDMVARYGGEEFAVLLAGCKARAAAQIAERLRRAVHRAAIVHGNRDDGHKVVSVSIGIASSEVDYPDCPEGFVSTADRNLYDAKRAGRNTVWPAVQSTP